MTKLYRKTATIRARRWLPGDPAGVLAWLDEHGAGHRVTGEGELALRTLESGDGYDRKTARYGAWIVQGSVGDFWRINDDVFAETYERVGDGVYRKNALTEARQWLPGDPNDVLGWLTGNGYDHRETRPGRLGFGLPGEDLDRHSLELGGWLIRNPKSGSFSANAAHTFAHDYEAAFDPEHAPAQLVARAFHDVYERLAPEHGYRTREATAKPWELVGDQHRELVVATVQALLDGGVIRFERTA